MKKKYLPLHCKKNKMRRSVHNSFIKPFLLALYVSFYIGNTFFVHTHHFPTY
ncbi:MAG: hypothetical protein LBT50_11650, partial [Prevotellaceae bacterium]|nr:hypothetical protein [Prevotellaceae bacterium]